MKMVETFGTWILIFHLFKTHECLKSQVWPSWQKQCNFEFLIAFWINVFETRNASFVVYLFRFLSDYVELLLWRWVPDIPGLKCYLNNCAHVDGGWVGWHLVVLPSMPCEWFSLALYITYFFFIYDHVTTLTLKKLKCVQTSDSQFHHTR